MAWFVNDSPSLTSGRLHLQARLPLDDVYIVPKDVIPHLDTSKNRWRIARAEQSEHKGFANLLKGCFGAVRNPLAHQPKILWDGEDDAADYLTMLSLMHRKLDEAVKTGFGGMKRPGFSGGGFI